MVRQHVGHGGHLRALARPGLIVMEDFFQIIHSLPGKGRQARIGAVAVDTMATVASLRPFVHGQRLPHVRLLWLLRGVVGRQILDRILVERRRDTFHRFLSAGLLSVGLQGNCEILRILAGNAWNRGIPTHPFGSMACGTGGGRARPRSSVTWGGSLSSFSFL